MLKVLKKISIVWLWVILSGLFVFFGMAVTILPFFLLGICSLSGYVGSMLGGFIGGALCGLYSGIQSEFF